MVSPKEKTKRRGAPKVRSGCKTCKIRRIKCDETKPSCTRCTDTGRRCDGYLPVFQFRPVKEQACGHRTSGDVPYMHVVTRKKRTPQTSQSPEPRRIGDVAELPPQVTEVFPGRPEERHLFNLFRERLAPGLGGGFDLDFWTMDLPRIARSEPAVYHAILAITAFRHNEMYEPIAHGLGTKASFLLHYNKAINFVQSKIHDDQVSQLVVLLTCLLFVCLEFRRGNTECALNHLQSGLGILAFQKILPDFVELQDSIESLHHAFSRLSIQGSLVGHPPPAKPPSQPRAWTGSTVVFTNINEARESLVQLFIESLRPIAPDFTLEASFSTLFSEQCRRAILISQLHQWNSQLGLFISDTLRSTTPQTMDMIRILRIQSLVAIIWNSTVAPVSNDDDVESRFDAYITTFKTIISLASFFVDDSLSSHSTSTTSSSPSSTMSPPSSSCLVLTQIVPAHESSSWPGFSLEMGLVFPLYFVTIKCRSPTLRRKANYYLSQLKTQREGMWDAEPLVKISQYVIEVEERSCVNQIGEDVGTWPSEEARVHGTFIQPWCDYTSRVQKVVFSWRPGGIKTEFAQWEKDIHF